MKVSKKIVIIAIFIISLAMATLSGCDLDILDANDYVCVHQWGDWKIVEQGDCKTIGIIRRECLKCGSIKEEETALKDHTEGEWIVDKVAVCEDGFKHTECTVCGELIRSETIPASNKHEYENDTCINCGVTNERCFEFVYIETSDSYAIRVKAGSYLPNEIVLPDTFKGKMVTEICNSAFSNSYITSVVIPKNIKKIGDYAFAECVDLYHIEIESGATSIGSYAFFNCVNITSIVIPESVTFIGEYAFDSCAYLADIIMPDTVTYIGEHAFNNTRYYNRTYNWVDGILYIGNHLIEARSYITDGCRIKDDVVAIANCAFRWCDNLTYIVIPDGVVKIGNYAFFGCENLSRVEISDSVSSIGGYAFAYCYNLKNVVIGEGVETIGESAFYKCTSLAEAIIPDSVISIDKSAFYGCTDLEKVEFGDSLETIGEYAFSNCDRITNIVTGSNQKTIGAYAFYDCDDLKNVVILDSVETIENSAFSSCTSLSNLTIGDGVMYIGSFAFSRCSKLAKVVIPKNVRSIGGCAFLDCENLSSVEFEDSTFWFVLNGNDDLSYLSPSNFKDSEKTVDYLTSTYCEYNWTRLELLEIIGGVSSLK